MKKILTTGLVGVLTIALAVRFLPKAAKALVFNGANV